MAAGENKVGKSEVGRSMCPSTGPRPADGQRPPSGPTKWDRNVGASTHAEEAHKSKNAGKVKDYGPGGALNAPNLGQAGKMKGRYGNHGPE